MHVSEADIIMNNPSRILTKMRNAAIVIFFLYASFLSINSSSAYDFNTLVAIERVKQLKPLAYGWENGASSFSTAIRASNDIIDLSSSCLNVPGMHTELIEAMFNKGMCYYHFNKNSLAILTYKQINRINNEYPNVHFNLG